jgi:hypothetical protein
MVNREIYETRVHSVGWGQTPNIFIGDVEPMNIHAYIYRFHVTDEYIIIFLDTEKYKVLYTSALRSSGISSVNYGIYRKFLGFTGISLILAMHALEKSK